MAYVRANTLTKGLSGAIGTLVFRQVGDKTIVSKKRPAQAKRSAQQLENSLRFKCAAAWAKNEMLDAEKKAYYTRMAKKLKMPNAYTAALSNYMRKGEVKNISVKQNKAKTAHIVRVNTYKKDFPLHKMKIAIAYADGNVIESDYAIKKDQHVFTYKIKQCITDNTPLTISVTLCDHEMNKVVKQAQLNIV